MTGPFQMARVAVVLALVFVSLLFNFRALPLPLFQSGEERCSTYRENDEEQSTKTMRSQETTTLNKINGTNHLRKIVPINRPLPALSKMPKSVEESLQMILAGRKDSRGTFVQIGANDGEMFDPLYPHMKDNKDRWIGLQVEPQPELYSRVSVLHADAPDWAFYHGALASKEVCQDGKISFCETKTPGVGDWKTQGQVNRITTSCPEGPMHFVIRPCLTSFDDLIYKHASPAYLKHVMEEEEEPSSTTKRKFHIDFLQIDVEGKDFEVLKMVDWELMRPVCVRYEYSHLGSDKEKAKEFMENLGYTYTSEAMDVLACRVQ